MLLDADDLALAPGVEQIVSGVSDDRVKPELMRCQIEVATSPSRSVAGALDDLLDLRSRVIRVAAEHALRVAGCGTHPYSLAEDQQLTARDRYRELAAELRYPLRREVCFGMHVHVAVGGPDKAMRVIEAMLADLPLCSRCRRRARSGGVNRRVCAPRERSSSSLCRVVGCPRPSARTRTTRSGSNASSARARSSITRTCGGTSGRIRASARSRCAVSTSSRVRSTASRSPGSSRRWSAITVGATTTASVLLRPIGSSLARTAGSPRATGSTPRSSMSTPTPRRRLASCLVDLLDRLEDDAAAIDARVRSIGSRAMIKDGTSADRQLALHRHGSVAAGDRPVGCGRDHRARALTEPHPRQSTVCVVRGKAAST